MTLDITGLIVFLLAVMPGFITQQSRHSLVPRPLESKTALEETGEYVLNSLLVHLFSLVCFRELLLFFNPRPLLAFGEAVLGQGLRGWGYEHRYLTITYLCFTLLVGFVLGLFRGYMALNQPVRNWLSRYSWFQRLLKSLHIPSFIEDGPVWHDVLRDRDTGNLTFVQIRMKSGCFYTGALERYSILKDSEKNKDFYLVNSHFRANVSEPYQEMRCKGILLNFSDVEAIEVFKSDKPIAELNAEGFQRADSATS